MKDNNITKVRGFFLVRGLFSLLCITALALTAVLFTGCFGFDERPESGGGEFVPVESISGIPTVSVPYIAISLSGTVEPENATNKKAEWSVKSDGGTNSVVEGTRLTANGEGTVTVTARIANGLGEGVDYTQDFDIVISLAVNTAAVKSISGVPAAVTVGEYTLKGRVVPDRAINTVIIWSVKDAGTTGAAIADNTLTTTARGTVVLTATVANGRLTEDYTEDFTIKVNKTVVAAGYYQTARNGSQRDIRPCYWIDGEKFDLEVPYTQDYGTGAYTRGIVYAGDTQYIAGYYSTNINQTGRTYTPCYWVNGAFKTIPATTANAASRTYSIAADTDGTVYIYGNNAGTRCLWKIVNGEVASTVTISPPSPLPTRSLNAANEDGQSYAYDDMTAPFAFFAVNNGNVYIPFSTTASNNNNYYWYWDGTTGTNVQISAFDSTVSSITSIAATSGGVYIAAQKNSTDPLYWRVGDAVYTLLELLDEWNARGTVLSIVEQNGGLWFYGLGNRNDSYWDAAGNFNYMPWMSYRFRTENVVFSEGDVYMVINDSSLAHGGMYGNDLGWMVGVGGQFRYFEGYQFYLNRASGFVVR